MNAYGTISDIGSAIEEQKETQETVVEDLEQTRSLKFVHSTFHASARTCVSTWVRQHQSSEQICEK